MNMDYSRIMNFDAERSVVSAVLNMGTDGARRAAKRLAPSDFCDKKAKEIFTAAVELASRNREVTPVTVRHLLRAKGCVDAKSLDSLMLELLDDTFAVIGFEEHMRIVRQLSVQRSAVLLSQRIAAAACSPQADFEGEFAPFVRNHLAELGRVMDAYSASFPPAADPEEDADD